MRGTDLGNGLRLLPRKSFTARGSSDSACVTDHLDQLFGGSLLRSGGWRLPQAADGNSSLFLHRQEYDSGSRRVLKQLKLRSGSGYPGHAGIGDDDIRAQLMDLAQAFGFVAGFSDYLDVRLVFQKAAHTLPQ